MFSKCYCAKWKITSVISRLAPQNMLTHHSHVSHNTTGLKRKNFLPVSSWPWSLAPGGRTGSHRGLRGPRHTGRFWRRQTPACSSTCRTACLRRCIYASVRLWRCCLSRPCTRCNLEGWRTRKTDRVGRVADSQLPFKCNIDSYIAWHFTGQTLTGSAWSSRTDKIRSRESCHFVLCLMSSTQSCHKPLANFYPGVFLLYKNHN